MDIEEIKKFLPQRYPFLMVDRVADIKPGKFIKTIKNVTANEPHFNGHFPNEPVMPGVLIVEAMAQSAGILGLVSAGRSSCEGYLYFLRGVEKTRFRRMVVPGDQMIIEAKEVSGRRGVTKFHCEAKVAGKLVASAELLIAEQKREIKEA